PTEASLFAQDLITGGLKFLLENGDFKTIKIPCSYGNHGRTTQKKKIATGAKNSFEWLMYNNLARQFADEPRVEFQIADGYLTYVDVFGYLCRFHHGDAIGYQGGVGGVTIPLNKFIARANQQCVAALDSLGHFHQHLAYSYVNKFQINGSLIGFGPYAQWIGA